MRILFFIHQREDFFKYRNDLKKYLESQGHEIHVLLPKNDQNEEFSTHDFDSTNFYNYDYKRTYLFFFGILKNFFLFKKLCKSNKFDLVVSFKFYPNILSGLYKIFNNTPRIISLVAGRGRFALPTISTMESLIFKVYTFLLNQCDTIIVQNKEDFDFFSKQLTKASLTIMNGSGANLVEQQKEYASISDFRKQAFANEHKIPNNKIIFLFSSRIIEEKGILELINAFKEKRISQKAFLCIAGWFDSKAIEDKVKDAISSSENVKYIGNHKSVILPMSIANCVILPSRYGEGIPRSLIEALAFSKPIITSDLPGCKETVIIRQNGILVNPYLVDDIVDAVNQMCLLNIGEVEMMSIKSKSIFDQRFSYKIVFKQFSEIISKK